LTDTFRQVLSQDQVSSDDQQRLTKVLSYINQLYTVYTGLVVYDRQGCVLAVSQAHLTPWIGQVLSDAWMTESLGLTDSQTYRVSAFEPTALYADQSTFIYAAAIAHTEDERQAVGGIGIIFDSTPQLSAILSDASSGSGSEEGFAIFYDNQQRIVSTTHPNLSVGSVLPLDLDMAQRTGSAIVSCALGRYVVGVAKSSGYREFKGCDDDYQYEVYAAVFTRIGDLINDSQLTSEVSTCALPSLDAGPKQELATFFIQNQCYAFDVKQVVECVDVQMFTRLASGHSLFSGYVKYHGHPIPVLDLSRYLGATALAGLQAIVIEDEGIKFAILIDRLGGVPEVPISAMTPVEVHLQDHLVSHIVTAEDASDAMLLILSTSKIRQLVAGGRAMADAMPALSTLLEVGHAASE
jgi:chemotaxis signal transduction protein